MTGCERDSGCSVRYRVERIGDVLVWWACPDHLAAVLDEALPVAEHHDQVAVTDLANEVSTQNRSRITFLDERGAPMPGPTRWFDAGQVVQ